MTTEEKQLLVKDICARIPFGLKCTTKANSWQGAYQIRGCLDGKIFLDCHEYNEGDDEWLVQNIVPYLRPIQSMTDEEMEDYARYKFSSDEIWEIVDFKRTGKGFINVNCKNRNDTSAQWTFQVNQKSPLENHKGIDWLNAHHFDYRGLIKMGLAKKAIEGIY